MQQSRPADSRKLAPEIQIEALHILKQRFGEDVEITACDIFSAETRRNVLARIHLKSARTQLPETIIFKQSLPRPSDPDFTEANDRFSRDWAGLEFANRIDPDSHYVPKFFGGSKVHRFILIEDLGRRQVSLVDSLLLPGNADVAVSALERYIRAVGKFHASGFGRTEEYLQILHDINPNAKTPKTELKFHSDFLMKGLETSNALLDMAITDECRFEINQVMAAIFNPGPFTVLIHGDLAPDNVFDHELPKGLQLIDFENAGVRNALIDGTYLRMSIPTGWCAKTLPDELIGHLESIYRTELAKNIEAAKDNNQYHIAYIQACAFWALVEMAHLHNKFSQDLSWGKDPGLPKHLFWDADNNSGRSRFLSRLKAFIDINKEHNILPNITKMAETMLATIHAKNSWPNAKPLDIYPAFNQRPQQSITSQSIFSPSQDSFTKPKKNGQTQVLRRKGG